MKTLRFFLCFLLSCLLTHAYSQGCSDAGFCTMGAMKPNQHFSHRYDLKLQTVEFTGYLGYTKFKDVIQNYIADLNFAINGRNSVQVKIPFVMVNGPLAKTRGIGDISLAYSRALIVEEKYQLGVTIGTKIPTNDANKKENGRSLPMYYQTSLGTYDYIFGAALVSKKWLFATGYQGTFNKNRNHFKWGIWQGLEDTPIALQYPVADNLKRGNDVMFRVERNFRLARFNFFTGLLPIYRLNQDVITSPQTKERVKVPESNGLALTFLNGFGYRFSAKSSVKVLGGIGIIQRETNPDGLSRDYVATITYQFRY